MVAPCSIALLVIDPLEPFAMLFSAGSMRNFVLVLRRNQKAIGGFFLLFLLFCHCSSFFIVSSIAVARSTLFLCFRNWQASPCFCCLLVRMFSAFFFQPSFFSRPCMHHPFHEPCLLPVACDSANKPMKQHFMRKTTCKQLSSSPCHLDD